MLNMIKLDWIGMKCYQKRFIIIPCTTLLYGFFFVPIVIPLMAFMMFSFSVNPFAVEEKGKLDNLYLTLPVTRKAIVSARYGLSLLMQLVGFTAGTVITILYSRLLYGRTAFGIAHSFHADCSAIFLIICGSLLLYAVMNLCSFPLLFKIGYARGRGLGFYVPIIGFAIVVSAVYMFGYFNDAFQQFLLSAVEWAFANTVWTAVCMLIGAALLLALSYMISQKVYARREF
ncbi:MAG: ABC-2 transporter permease [Firmicutes bacterium]|nr:ABC-2 transporter permease [Bacillota bacterium]